MGQKGFFDVEIRYAKLDAKGDPKVRGATCECICLNAFVTGSEARAGIGRWIPYYNTGRPHSALGGRTPLEAHRGGEGHKLAA